MLLRAPWNNQVTIPALDAECNFVQPLKTCWICHKAQAHQQDVRQGTLEGLDSNPASQGKQIHASSATKLRLTYQTWVRAPWKGWAMKPALSLQSSPKWHRTTC